MSKISKQLLNRIAIIADGDFPESEFPRHLIRTASAVVCCDGAVEKYVEFSGGKLPDAVVGDMDSLRTAARDAVPAEEKARDREGRATLEKIADICIQIDEQDDCDLAKAVHYACSRWASASLVQIFGATGRCEDHTIGNYGHLMQFSRDLKGRNFELISDYTTAFVMTDSDTFDCGEGRTISFFTADNSLRVSSKGLQWPLDGVVFDYWWKATRNRAVEDRISLKFNHPSALLVILN